MIRRLISLFFVLLSIPALAMHRPRQISQAELDQLYALQLQQELFQNEAPQQEVPRRVTIDRDEEIARALQQEMEQQNQNNNNNYVVQDHRARQEQERIERDLHARQEREMRDRAIAQALMDEEFARELAERESQHEEEQARRAAEHIALQDQFALEQEQIQIHADEELARTLEQEATDALMHQLQAEEEADYQAYLQYQTQLQEEQIQAQLEQRRQKLEQDRNTLEQERRQFEQQRQQFEQQKRQQIQDQLREQRQNRQQRIDEQRRQQRWPQQRPEVNPDQYPHIHPQNNPRQQPFQNVQPQQARDKRRGLIAPCVFNNVQDLRLPGLTGGGLRVEGVYHLQSMAEVPERQGWSCGFHSIYNIVKLERRICNRQISDQAFMHACQRFTRNQHGASDLEVSLPITQTLGVPYCFHMEYTNRSEPFLGERFYEEREFWQAAQRAFASPGPLCIHFDCHIESWSVNEPGHHEPHAVLITLVKMANGATAFYIFDNCNEDENHESQRQIREHLEHIYRQLFR